MIATLLSRLRSPRKISAVNEVFLHIATESRLGEPFEVRIEFPRALRRDMPSALAFELVERVTDASGSTTSRGVSHAATFIAALSVDLAESAYTATVVAPADRHASIEVQGGISYEWWLLIGSNALSRQCGWPVVMHSAANATGGELTAELTARQQAGQTTATLAANSAGTAADFAARYRELRELRELRAPEASILTALVPPGDCAITHAGRLWQARFAPRGFHAGPRLLASLAIGSLVWAFYPLLFAEPDIDSYVLAVVFGRITVAVLFAAITYHFAARRFHVSISPEGLVATHASPLRHYSLIVPLAKLSHFACELASVEITGRHFCRVRAVQHQLDTGHAVSPMLSAPGAIAVLVIEMNDALADVQHYGVTPAPEVAAYVFTDRERITAKLSVLALLTLAWTTAFIFFHHVRSSL